MIDLNSDVVCKVKDRYKQAIHPLIMHRSAERAKTPGDLFDILDKLNEFIKSSHEIVKLECGDEVDVCTAYPLVWHEEQHCWVKTDDLFQSMSFINKQKEQKEQQ